MKIRNRKLTIRLSEAEKNHLQRQADLAGLGVEPFLRQLIMGVEIRPRPPDELPELIRQMAAIGNNVNQIARIANSTKHIRREDLSKVETMLSQLWEKVKNI